jgi:hypothetical protein
LAWAKSNISKLDNSVFTEIELDYFSEKVTGGGNIFAIRIT